MIDDLIYLLFIFFISDFVFQSDDMALNKSDVPGYLYAHCLVIFITMFIGSAFIIPANYAWGLSAFNVSAHLGIDAISCQLTSYLYTRGRRHWFFVVIGLDQFLHIYILLSSGFIILSKVY